MKFEIKKKLIIYLFTLLIFSIFFLYTKHQVGSDSTISEWLINYEGGFTKRGLIGQISIFTARVFDQDLRWIIFLYQSAFCFIYFILIFKLLSPLKYDRLNLLVVFSPIFLLYPVAEIEVLARKEVIIFTLYLIYLMYPIQKFKEFAFGLFYFVSILIWEPTVFYTPIFFAKEIIENKIEKINYKLIRFFLAIIPGIILAIFIALNPIAEDNYASMAKVLQYEFNQNCYMSCELLKTKSTVLDQFRGNIQSYSLEVFIRYILIILIGFGPLFYIFHNSKLKKNNLIVFKIFKSPLVSILICLSPVTLLFAMGYDWGRWVNISYVFCVIFYFYLREKKLIFLKYNLKTNIINNLNKNYFLIIFLIFSFSWNPKTVITGDVASFPGYRIPYKTIKYLTTGHF